MFKKVVAHISLSASAMTQLNDYAKQLNKNLKIRKLTLFFILLTSILQLFVFTQNINSTPPKLSTIEDISQLSSQDTNLQKSIKSLNLTQSDTNAGDAIAQPNDTILYTLEISNNNETTVNTDINLDISDVVEYSTVADAGDGKLIVNNNKSMIHWSEVSIVANSTQTKSFIIKILDKIPTTAIGKDNSNSYDCKGTVSFGNTSNLLIQCPLSKNIESMLSTLPYSSPTTNLLAVTLLMSVCWYFYARDRQLHREIILIKHNSIGNIL